MTTTLHPDRFVRPTARHTWLEVWTSIVAVAHRVRVLAALLIAWFAAEPARIRFALFGVAASVTAGVAVGAAAGVAVARVVEVLLGFLETP